MIAATGSSVSVSTSVLSVAFELGQAHWKLALTSGFGVPPLVKTVRAGDFGAVDRALTRARATLGLDAASAVVSCDEAGRDGLWVHHALTARGVQNRVVDSASIEVNRRARRLKTDRVDAIKLVLMLVRKCLGDARGWREVRVPDREVEAGRHASRERQALVADRTRLVNQMRSWLATLGTTLPARRDAAWWTRMTDWAGQPLPAPVQARLARAHQRVELLETQIAALEQQQAAAIRAAPAESPAWRLVRLKGVGATSTAILLEEGLVWRAFKNRRKLGGLLGVAPMPFTSGRTHHEQGIVARAMTACRRRWCSWRGAGCGGNRRVRWRWRITSALRRGRAPAKSGLSRSRAAC